MQAALVKVELQSVTGLPEDVVDNTWHFVDPTAVGPLTDTQQASLLDAVIGFYTNAPGGAGAAVDEFLSWEIARDADVHRVKLYLTDTIGVDWGSPNRIQYFTLGPASVIARSMPGEVAAVLSIEADTTDVPEESGSTRPAARRRGRKFIGPLVDDACEIADGVAAVQRPALSFLTVLRNAAQDLKTLAETAGPTGPNMSLAVLSEADGVARPAVAVATDDAFDTQRRRGAARTRKDRLVLV